MSENVIVEDAYRVFTRAKFQLADRSEFDLSSLDSSLELEDVLDMSVVNTLRRHLTMLDSYPSEASGSEHTVEIERESITISDRELLVISVLRLSDILYANTETVEKYRKTTLQAKADKQARRDLRRPF